MKQDCTTEIGDREFALPPPHLKLVSVAVELSLADKQRFGSVVGRNGVLVERETLLISWVGVGGPGGTGGFMFGMLMPEGGDCSVEWVIELWTLKTWHIDPPPSKTTVI